MPDIEALRVLATEAKARADAATPGPWIKVAGPINGPFGVVVDQQWVFAVAALIQKEENADLCAAARTDVPALADAVLASVDEINSLVRAVAAKNEVLLEMKAELEAARARIAALEDQLT